MKTIQPKYNVGDTVYYFVLDAIRPSIQECMVTSVELHEDNVDCRIWYVVRSGGRKQERDLYATRKDAQKFALAHIAEMKDIIERDMNEMEYCRKRLEEIKAGAETTNEEKWRISNMY